MRPEARARSWRGLARKALVVAVLSWQYAVGAGHAIRTATSFVTPTYGSDRSLTLTTYLTDAADLHYAAVPTGHAPLEASTIRDAAQRCRTGFDTGNAAVSDGICSSLGNNDIFANTLAVERAQKLETIVDGLAPNTSYDVYFVAEVPNSNGVYGQVISVPATPTHPAPPAVNEVSVVAANGSAEALVVNMSLTSPGIVHIALVPNREDANYQLSIEDIVSRSHHGLAAVFMTTSRLTWEGLTSIQMNAGGLLPATVYDMLFVTEAVGSGGVRSELTHMTHVARTHPNAPDVATLACIACNGSATDLVITFQLMFNTDELNRVTLSSLPFYSYRLHYETKRSPAPQVLPNEAAIKASEKTQGKFTIGPFSTLSELHEASAITHTRIIGALEAGTTYGITVFTEAINSYGVYGQNTSVDGCTTHAIAPRILSAEVKPTNKSVNALTVGVKLERTGNVHYLAGLRSLHSIRSYFSQAKSIDHLKTLIAERESHEPVLTVGVAKPSTFVSTNASNTGDYSCNFTIDGLVDATLYSIVLIPETTGSFGVLGAPYAHLLEAGTNENASTVVLYTTRPQHGNLSSVELVLSMSRPADVLFYCIHKVMPLLSSSEFTSDFAFAESYARDDKDSLRSCKEVPKADLHQTGHGIASNVTFVISNLMESTEYGIQLYAESEQRNGVVSIRTMEHQVKTHDNAARILKLNATPVAAHPDAISVTAQMDGTSLAHYAIEEVVLALPDENRVRHQPNTNGADPGSEPVVEDLSVEAIVQRNERANHKISSRERAIVKRGSVVIGENCSVSVIIDALKANTTYIVHMVTESSPEGTLSSTSGVYGAIASMNVTSHALAPVIIKATAGAATNATDAILIAANLSAPGHVYFSLSDIDFADPHVISKRHGSSDDDLYPTDTNAEKQSVSSSTLAPHVVRGIFSVVHSDISMELLNGSNESTPVEPTSYASQVIVSGLKEGTTYHVSLTTETNNSNGVFGEFPPPIIATTHLPAPIFVPNTFRIGPSPGSSSSVFVEFRLSQLGNVHYALFFRGLIRDRSFDSREEEEIKLEKEREQERELERKRKLEEEQESDHDQERAQTKNQNHDPKKERDSEEQRQKERQRLLDEEKAKAAARRKEPAHRHSGRSGSHGRDSSRSERSRPSKLPEKWPPVSSSYDISQLSASLLKNAAFDELGEGVWENGTISVSRDDITKRVLTVKTIDKLPPNAIFDLCLVTETEGSDGIFAWDGASDACHRVVTHAEYSSQSILFDEFYAFSVDGRTDSIQLELSMSKLLDAPESTATPQGGTKEGVSPEKDASVLKRFKVATGRVPYFIVVDGKDGRPGFSHNTFTHSRMRDSRSPFQSAIPGRGNVVATGQMLNIVSENATFLTISHRVDRLTANHRYFVFFAYETTVSDGVFTKVNPHKHRPNDTKSEDEAIEVTTHEQPPRLVRYEAAPSYGKTTQITLTVDVSCTSCTQAVVHAFVYKHGCPAPSLEVLRHASETTESQEPRDDTALGCDNPLVKHSFTVDMPERQTTQKDIAQAIDGDSMLRANTTYDVYLATETAQSQGVLSNGFDAVTVTTFAPAPGFQHLTVRPRNGSTTELLLEFALDRPGEVHYMLGLSGNPELNATSPYNVSNKSPDQQTGHHARKFHNYGRDVVRMRRSVKVPRAEQMHVEVLEYLTQGTTYDVFVLAESADDMGIYGEIRQFPVVSTFANAPMLLEHTVYPTLGSVSSLTVGFRVNGECLVHFSVVTSTLWTTTAHVARDSDVYGNRLAMLDQLIQQESVEVDAASLANQPDLTAGSGVMNHDSGWREVNINVPHPGANYTVHLVTETIGSDGVYGTVATHRGVQSHAEPPSVDKVEVTPTDARVDALTVNITLSAPGHVHYAVVRKGEQFNPEEDMQTTVAAVGVADARKNHTINGTDVTTSDATPTTTVFTIKDLRERTAYDVYVKTETLDSGGVYGSWTLHPVSARTHGLPAEVLADLACNVAQPCETIGRVICSREPNVCGECLQGYTGIDGSSNVPCQVETHLDLTLSDETRNTSPTTNGASIKINGVRINRKRMNAEKETTAPTNTDSIASMTTESTGPEETTAVSDIGGSAEGTQPTTPSDMTSASTTAKATVADEERVMACPLHAHLGGTGQCECMDGYEVDDTRTRCVPSTTSILGGVRTSTASTMASTSMS